MYISPIISPKLSRASRMQQYMDLNNLAHVFTEIGQIWVGSVQVLTVADRPDPYLDTWIYLKDPE